MEFVEKNCVSDDERTLRTAVFVQEQGFEEEFDAVDESSDTKHLVMYDDGPVACCRYFPGGEPGQWILGRVAVLPHRRGAGLASRVVCEAERRLRERRAKKISLGAQSYVKSLYEKLGYTVTGAPFFDEKVEHVPMSKDLA